MSKGSHDIKSVTWIFPKEYAGGATPAVTKGPAINRLPFEEARVALHHGVIEAGCQLDAKVQESPTETDGDFTDITGALFSQLDGGGGGLTGGIYEGRLNLQGRKKYLRVVTTVTGNGLKAAHSAEVVLMEPKEKPVAPVNPLAFNL
jgi:hypothetical protein